MAGSPSPIALAGALLGAMRPKQWVKNVLVAVAPAAAGTLFHGSVFLKTLVAFVAFSLVASGLYLVNDIRDVEADRAHPRKSRRPIASGALPIPVAWGASGVLLLAGLALGGLVATWQLAVTLVVYALITTAYTLRLKTVPVIELACVASGFVLRATGGGAATDTRLSVWFVVVISFGALFIAAGKRLAEMPTATSEGEHRAVLQEYSRSFLQSTLILCATISITGYCLWAFESTGIVSRAHGREIFIELTVVPVVIGALHVLRLLDRGDGGAPEELAYHDRILQALGLVWVALMVIGLYG